MAVSRELRNVRHGMTDLSGQKQKTGKIGLVLPAREEVPIHGGPAKIIHQMNLTLFH
jgi:hypothetical protein